MRKLFCLLLCLGLLTGCQSVETGEPAPVDLPKDEYVWEEVGATILLPEGTMTYCDVHIADRGARPRACCLSVLRKVSLSVPV